MFGLPLLNVALTYLRPEVYDDFVDRLNYVVTSAILVIFSMLVGCKQQFGHPIQCYVPAEYRYGWEEYVEDYCFIEGTYYVPSQDLNLFIKNQRDIKLSDLPVRHNYYQWVPYLFAIMALMFYAPHLIWSLLHNFTGFDMKSLIKMARESGVASREERTKKVNTMAWYIEDTIGLQYDLGSVSPSENTPWMCGSARRVLTGKYMSCLYILIKLLYLMNLVGQFLIMNWFLAMDDDDEHRFWGFRLLTDILNGKTWLTTGHFPRVTYCNYEIAKLGKNVHTSTVVCVLMINMINEKLFIFLWFWYFIVAIITAVSLLYTTLVYIVPDFRDRMVFTYLRAMPSYNNHRVDFGLLRRFTLHALRPDGVMVIRFVADRAGHMVAVDLTAALWKDFLDSVGRTTMPHTQLNRSDPPSYRSDGRNGSIQVDPGFIGATYPSSGPHPITIYVPGNRQIASMSPKESSIEEESSPESIAREQRYNQPFYVGGPRSTKGHKLVMPSPKRHSTVKDEEMMKKLSEEIELDS